MQRIIVALVAFLPFGVLAQKDAGRPTPEPACKALVVSSSPVASQGIAGPAPRFSATKIENLYFTLLLRPDQKALDVIELRLFTPRGGRYQSIVVPVGPPTEVDRRLAGYPHPVRVRAVASVSYAGAAASAVVLPPFLVAGTSIVEGSLYGGWRAEARIGNGDLAALAASAPCATLSFILTQ